jgi:ZIP family zinc transporter
MLPSAKRSLQEGGFSERAASWILIGLFLGGAFGIQLASRIMHHFLPSHVVDCDHTHDDDEPDDEEAQHTHYEHDHDHDHDHAEETHPTDRMKAQSTNQGSLQKRASPLSWNKLLLKSKSGCEADDCYGFTNPCGNCFKNMSLRDEITSLSSRPHMPRSITEIPTITTERTPLLRAVHEESTSLSSSSHSNGPNHISNGKPRVEENHAADHHHHVPTNAFLSIGLQTSIAIALHKLPEGFITYATNHANPKLGVAIFISLFVHNITEGFALALPLYLALKSRPKAMLWAAILGGVSQPLGAGIAALWFHIAGNHNMTPGEAVYGGMFGVVAGIMTSVALQLMGESLQLTHNRDLCFIFAFIGMGILGASSAMTA